MMKVNLKDYLWNAYEIRQNNPEAANSIGIASDMLRANIYHGLDGNPGTDLDWPALKARWDAMTSEEQAQSRAEYRELRKELIRLPAADLVAKGDRAGFDALVAQAEANVRAAAEAQEKE